jgi:8-oxo-dGTP pyrophosphatase MutT (NUDIX family)
MKDASLEAARFAALARHKLSVASSCELMTSPSDFDLNPGTSADPLAVLKPAAVLIGIVARTQPTILLTQRSYTLSQHAGQIAFPGGRIDATDASPTAAALREAEEEVGLASRHVQPLGFLSTYRTGTGYAIEPLVALVDPAFTLTLQEREVAEAFEVPLSFLMDDTNHHTQTRMWHGHERRFYVMPYENRYIWGATAGILKNMHKRLFDQ